MVPQETPFRRLQVIIRPSRDLHLRAYQGPMIHALGASAWGEGAGVDPVFPDGWLPHAPEQCRTLVRAGEPYAFGLTLIERDDARAAEKTSMLVEGLHAIAARAPKSNPVWGGNFTVDHIEDLVAGQPWHRSAPPRALATEALAREVEALSSQPTATLVFTSPLRMKRPASALIRGRHFFDEGYFNAAVFLSRVAGRLQDLGLHPLEQPEVDFRLWLEVEENRLVWLDTAYGPKAGPKRLAGCCGRLRMRLNDPRAAALLVWGRLAGAGESTRFGFGQWMHAGIEECLAPCTRSHSLLHFALANEERHELAMEGKLPSGQLESAISRVQEGTYEPAPVRRITFRHKGRERELAIPAPIDLTLQRLVLRDLGPSLDLLFEDSSLAWRKGLGRHHAAHRLRSAHKEGYQFALKADFRRFFDNIDHALLRDRLDVYLQDDQLVDLLFRWIEKGAPTRGRGLPTGAPLSPLMANLFLDRFDEEIAREGARLVRYGDDFLILFRNKDGAERHYKTALQATESLLLELNSEKTALVDLHEPFEFLGFQFQRRDNWKSIPHGAPSPLTELGWSQSPRKTPPTTEGDLALPGECPPRARHREATVALGPGVRQIHAANARIIIEWADGRPSRTIPLSRIEQLLILGGATLTTQAITRLFQRGIPVWFATDHGRLQGTLCPSGTDALAASARTLQQQVDAENNPTFRLAIVKTLVASKLENHGTLARRIEVDLSETDWATSIALHEAAAKCHKATSTGQLRGIEGAAARRWYALLARAIPHHSSLRFYRRVAPNANDPVNILLNIGYTRLHREAAIALEMAGLFPPLGLYHESRSGHDALASDLQEPFRHLVDRTVLLLTRCLNRGDFIEAREESNDPFPLRLKPSAARTVTARFEELFHLHCQDRFGAERSYRDHLHAAARAMRSAIQHRDPTRFMPLRHEQPIEGNQAGESRE